MYDFDRLNFTKNSKLLVVMPHPDDEAVFAAGLIYKTAMTGVDVDLCCMTNGEKSTHRHGLKQNDDLSTVRKKEVEEAARIMGVKTLICANLPDGGLSEKWQDVMDFLIREVNEFKPTHVLTLEPDGIYGHPDHIMLSLVITRMQKAFKKSGRHDFELIYATVPDMFKPDSKSHKMTEKEVIKPIKANLEVELSLFEQYKKKLVCMAHYSQFGKNEGFWDRWEEFGMFEKEYFFVVE